MDFGITMNKIQLGGIWLDDCRIPYDDGVDNGRHPANLLVCDDILNDGRLLTSKKCKAEYVEDNMFGSNVRRAAEKTYNDSGSFSRYFDLDKWFDMKEQLEKTD